MCLTIDNIFKSDIELKAFIKNTPVTKKDIIVYKVLECVNKKYFGPYQGFRYQKGFQYTESNFTHDRFYHKTVFNQGLHACTSKQKAEKHCLDLKNWFNKKCEVVEMVIPKGSKVFKGNDKDIITNNLIWY